MKSRRDSCALILGAACAEFARHGYAGARVARIAANANVNKQLIFYYFGSKAGLYSAATESAQADNLEPEGVASPPEHFRAVLNRLADHLITHPELATALADPATGAGYGAAPGRQFLEQAVAAIGASISRGQGMGYFRDDLDPAAAARQATALLAGFHVLAPSLNAGDPARWGPAAADLLLRAFTW
jgi:TetR/AcrR family transcriptional regulator